MNAPRLTKWPFYLVDLLLMGLACGIFAFYPHPLDGWAAGLITASVVVAAFLAVWPYRLEYEAQVKSFTADRLTDATQAINELETVAGRIQQATAQWQGVQDHASRTTQTAREIADRIEGEARAFSDFMSKANDSEKATLRLEVEKLRRNEGQWLQVLVHTLDHVHALYQAANRSGQVALTTQLAAFQAACRDLARRVGLMPIDAEVGHEFDSSQHEVVQGHAQPEGPTRIAQIVATGFSFQGQIIRRPIVILVADESPSATETSTGNLGETPAPSGDFDATALEIEPAPVEETSPMVEVSAPVGEASAESQGESPELGELPHETEADPETELERQAQPQPELQSEPVVLEQPEPEGKPIEDEFRLESEPARELRRRAGNG